MIVAHAGNGDDSRAFASGSSNELSEAVVTVSMTTGDDVDWYRLLLGGARIGARPLRIPKIVWS